MSIRNSSERIRELRQDWKTPDDCKIYDPQSSLYHLWTELEDLGIRVPPRPTLPLTRSEIVEQLGACEELSRTSEAELEAEFGRLAEEPDADDGGVPAASAYRNLERYRDARRTFSRQKLEACHAAFLDALSLLDRATLEAAVEAKREIGDDQTAIRRLLNIYTDGLADERLGRASDVLKADRTVDEKLQMLDALIPIPPTVSARALGEALGVTKAAVQKTSWYIQNRKGQNDLEAGRRQERYKQRGQQHKRDRKPDDV